MKTKEDYLKPNRADEAFHQFIGIYKYEIIASFGLIALLGGIVLSLKVLELNSSQIESGGEIIGTSTKVSTLMVDVSGAVKQPGVYTFDQGARIKEAISQAGGLTEEADQVWLDEVLNQAELLVDGQKIHIPDVSLDEVDGSDSAPEDVKDGLVSLNRGSKEELMSLPGIGQAYAQRIIDDRPYQTVDDLLRVSGIGSKKLAAIRDLVKVN